MEKMTKAMWFEAIKEVIVASDAEQKDEMVEFIDAQMEQLAKKAEKAKERAATKKAEGDALTEAVKAVLTDEAVTRDVIAAKVAETYGEDATIAKVGYRLTQLVKAKVTARLTQLVKAEEAVKEQIKVGERKVMGYKAC